MVKKYLAIYKYMVIRTLQFRSELVVYSFLDILPFLVLFFVWQAVYVGKDSINGYSFPQLIEYYLVVMLIERCSSTHFESWRAREIKDGKIDYFLTRPFSYSNEVFSKDVGAKIISLIISLPIYVVFYHIVRYGYNLSTFDFAPLPLIFFAFSMVIAYVFQFMFAFWIVLLTFWFEGSEGLQHFKAMALTLFSGAMIPVEFMPTWLQQIVEWLPLKYVYAFPIAILQGKAILTLRTILSIACVTLGMLFITQLLWKKAQYKYASAGG